MKTVRLYVTTISVDITAQGVLYREFYSYPSRISNALGRTCQFCRITNALVNSL